MCEKAGRTQAAVEGRAPRPSNWMVAGRGARLSTTSVRGYGRAQGNRCRRRPAWGRGCGGQADLSWSCCRIDYVRPALVNPCRGRHRSEDGRWYFSDRLGDTFRWKSENVSTNEVAEVLSSHPEVHEANVYGVALPNHDGRAGCAALVLNQQLASGNASGPALKPSPATLESIAVQTLNNLPRYAAPLFLRFTPEMQSTGNNKQQKHILRTEGVDLAQVSKNDHLYWLQGNSYVPYEQKDWDRLNGGQVRL